MAKIEIKSRFDGSVLFALECGSLKLCIEAAVKQGANLDGANLYGANLDGANLDGANLVRANLYGANLVRANLYGANLVRANLDGANLDGANLVRANLYGANLDGANLVRANLVRANLYGANLDGANFDIPVATREEAVKNLDIVGEIILDNQALLEMAHWHEKDGWQKRTCLEEATCGTTHCLAGWLQICATNPKVKELDPQLAGIVQAPIAAHMFFRDNSEVLAWLKNRDYAKTK